MSLQLVRIVLFLAFLSVASTMDCQEKSDLPFSVIQTPPFLNAMEGSDVTLNCSMEDNGFNGLWYVAWQKMGEGKKITNSTRIFVMKNEKNKSSNLILKAADVADSGIYQCYFGYFEHCKKNNTEVKIWEMPSVVVTQTPRHVNETEGANVTIKCQFRRPANLSLMEVKWHKDNQELSSSNHSVQLSQEGTLMLMNANVEDSGNYVCTVRIRNRTGSGNGTHVHIHAANLLVIQSPAFIQATERENLTIDCSIQGKEANRLPGVTWSKTASDGQKSLMTQATPGLEGWAPLVLRDIKKEDSGNYTCEVDRYAGREKPSQNANISADNRQPSQPHETIGSGIGIPVGVGVVVGTLIFLLLLGILVWRSKRKGKGISGNPSELNPALTEEARKHTSLTNQVSNVTYADLRFHKREAQPDAEVVYAEVRGAKRPGPQGRATQPAGLH